MSKFLNYAAAQLAAAGFAVLDSNEAARLRPDLFLDAIEAAQDRTSRALAQLRGLPRIRRFEVETDDGRRLEILAWTPVRLAERLHWVLGCRPLALRETTPAAPPAPAAPAEALPHPGGDRHPGLAGPRITCETCTNLSAGHSCLAPEISDVERPLARVPRACKGFAPMHGGYDRRTARQLWPALFADVAPAPAAATAEPHDVARDEPAPDIEAHVPVASAGQTRDSVDADPVVEAPVVGAPEVDVHDSAPPAAVVDTDAEAVAELVRAQAAEPVLEGAPATDASEPHGAKHGNLPTIH